MLPNGICTRVITTALIMGNAPKMTMSLIMNSSRAYLEKRTWNMSSSTENIKCCTQQGPASPTLPNGGKEGGKVGFHVVAGSDPCC